MLKFKIYIDTSVIGGCFDDEFAEYSNLLIDEFIMGKKIAVISNITLKELSKRRKRLGKNWTKYQKKTLSM